MAKGLHREAFRSRLITLAAGALFGLVGLQLVRLALTAEPAVVIAASETIGKGFARPDIIDRRGRLLATDVMMPSLFADPSIVPSRDEVAERLVTVIPDLDPAEVLRQLENRQRRFVWLRRGLSPAVAQAVHNLGLPGLSFRTELRRAFPLGKLAGHTLGGVSVDNEGIAGIERYIDENNGTEAVHGATLSSHAPVRLTIDVGVQHSLADELASAMGRYQAEGASGLVMDVANGEVLASVSLPAVDPIKGPPGQGNIDRITSGTYELGSILKAVTVAMALDRGQVRPETVLDTTQPLTAGRFTITDSHPAGRPLSVREIFVRSSNVGAAMLALDAGAAAQTAFLDRLGLTNQMRTEAGPVARPQLPAKLGRVEQITVSYGHGMALAPIQFAAAAAALVNGGTLVRPTFVRASSRGADGAPVRVISEATSAAMRTLLRETVTDAAGTGRRADVPGFRVGGKTGTAELPGRGGYREKAVIASFLGAFPMDRPRYLLLISLFEPKASEESRGEILAGLNAAPTAARIIERIAPMLDVAPTGPMAAAE